MAANTHKPALSQRLLDPPLQTLHYPLFEQRGVRVKVLRLDLMHPDLGGNKWFKLRLNLEAITTAGVSRMAQVISFGGAYSNHLRALAAAGREFGLATLGFVRGEETTPLNPVLEFARQCGMELRYLSRSDYRRRAEPDFIQQLTADLGNVFVLPEGGSNELGVSGCEVIASYLHWESASNPHWLLLACGTGATAAGIIRGLRDTGQQRVKVRGVSVLKAPGYLQRQVSAWLPIEADSTEAIDWQILDDYHCGGYARETAALRENLAAVSAATGLPLEPLYTGKLILALMDQVAQGLLPAGSEVIVIHTGGIHPSTKNTPSP